MIQERGGAMEQKNSGWLMFAAIVLGVAGIMRVFDAIWAFRYHGALPQNFEDAIFGHSLKTYGWVYLVVAIVLILCAVGVMARSQVSRWIGIFAGAVLSISAIWWMPFYPVWSLAYILAGILVIYSLAVYGGQRGSGLGPIEKWRDPRRRCRQIQEIRGRKRVYSRQRSKPHHHVVAGCQTEVAHRNRGHFHDRVDARPFSSICFSTA